MYIYAIFSGLISLAIPLGIQSIIGYVMAGRLNTSWFLLAVAISTFVLFAGLTRLAQISIIDSLQRRLFLFFGERFKTRLMSTNSVIADEKTVLYFLDITTLQKSLSKLLVDFSGKLLQAFFWTTSTINLSSIIFDFWWYCFISRVLRYSINVEKRISNRSIGVKL